MKGVVRGGGEEREREREKGKKAYLTSVGSLSQVRSVAKLSSGTTDNNSTSVKSESVTKHDADHCQILLLVSKSSR